MIVKEHCKPGGWRNPEGWLPVCDWSEDTTVQWGGSNGHFFFEAYPPGTFITGHGSTVAEAEADAFKTHQSQVNCVHEYTRFRKATQVEYTNGAGFCKHCEHFKSKAFEPIQHCCQCNDPHGYGHDNLGRWWCETCYKAMPEELMTDVAKELRRMNSEP